MNKELLFNLYRIHSESGNEKKMRHYLRKVAMDCGADSVETDKYGNLLIVKGESDTYPCLAAHMDQVQRSHSKDFRVIQIDDDVLGWSPKCHEQQGLGADDKNGIFICMELLRMFDVMKVAFFVGEEVGCKGSSQVDLDFFKDCRFIIEPDRRGCSDLITSMSVGAVCSEEFVKAIGYEAFGYKEDHGTITDIGELVERGVGISCLNLSCGYYDAHTDHEITVLSHLENCMNFVAHIVETCKEVYTFEYVREEYSGRFGHYGRYNGYGNNYGVCYGTKKQPLSDWYDEYDRYDEHDEYMYYNSGYYDMDTDLMIEYLEDDPGLSLDIIVGFYAPDFYASYYFVGEGLRDVITDIYNTAKGCIEHTRTDNNAPTVKKVS